MKRRDLIRHLRANKCALAREGSNHSIWFNSLTRRTSAVPRHREIHEFLAKKICRDLDVPLP